MQEMRMRMNHDSSSNEDKQSTIPDIILINRVDDSSSNFRIRRRNLANFDDDDDEDEDIIIE